MFDNMFKYEYTQLILKHKISNKTIIDTLDLSRIFSKNILRIFSLKV